MARLARLITTVVAWSLLAGFALTPASELVADPARFAPEVASSSTDGGGGPHDCHLLPLHGTQALADRGTPTRPVGHDPVTGPAGAPVGAAAPVTTLALAAGPLERADAHSAHAPQVLQVFRQ
ncbi:hypothetical protein GCM10023321_37880 [Pseudonocardia eucalypti]|uniref:Secreted protein n=1 Tax=Pseudonocardia eucalypti TaxID=648755 RepID=A0ABP9Q7Z6_9PSEU|nr:hypothetical protein [Pseudonocardia eucalypti]